MSTKPDTSKYSVITYEILSDGSPIDPGCELISIEVIKEANRIPSACLVFKDGDPAEEKFSISNTDTFLPGKAIDIKVGRDSENELLFSGMVVKHRVKARINGESELIVDCKDKSVKMAVGRQSRYFEEKKDSEVIEELIGAYSDLSHDVEDTGTSHAELVQYHSTDYDFMVSRADMNGQLVIINDGEVSVKKPDTSQDSVMDLHYGKNLLQFDAEMEARTQYKKVGASSWDPQNQTLFQVESSTTDFEEAGNFSGAEMAEAIDLEEYKLQHGGRILEHELQSWTNSYLTRSRLAALRGFAHVQDGTVEVKPGEILEVKGVGNRFNGKVFVSSVKHVIESGQWDMLIQFGFSPDWFAAKEKVIDYPAAGMLPAIKGLQIGVVRQLENDPEGSDRILVNFPIIEEEGTGIWARVANLDAGENRGTYFRPEIGDEVIVGFLNEDPRCPVVLGALYSSAKPSPIPGSDDNHIKGIVTRSEMKLLFDDEKNIVTLETPAGNLFEISEDEQSMKLEDQNGNKIVLSPDGIEISSPKDIVINATGKIEQSATQDLSVEGLNVDISANAQLKAAGQAGAELSSSGQAVVKGAIVQIN